MRRFYLQTKMFSKFIPYQLCMALQEVPVTACGLLFFLSHLVPLSNIPTLSTLPYPILGYPSSPYHFQLTFLVCLLGYLLDHLTLQPLQAPLGHQTLIARVTE